MLVSITQPSNKVSFKARNNKIICEEYSNVSCDISVRLFLVLW